MALSLKVSALDGKVVKTMYFDPSDVVFDALRKIRERVPEAHAAGNPQEFGLFLSDDDPKKGVWLENGRPLEYYLLRSGDLLEYRKKARLLRVRMLDGTVKTLNVDDSNTVAQLMIVICSKIGIANHEEYSLVHDVPLDDPLGHHHHPHGHPGPLATKMGTLRKGATLDRSTRKMEEMKRRIPTDDDINWLDHSKTLREQGIDEAVTLLLKRKFFFSDQNVDARDPVQLNLLYVQCRDAIINGNHPVSLEKALEFAGLQAQIQFGDHVEQKHKRGFIDLKEFLPKEYLKTKEIEKKIYFEHRKHAGVVELDAKVSYTHLARSLKTYGVTFFLVKEKMKGKNRLVPRLLGVTKDSVIRMDEKTKDFLKVWPLTTVKRWAASPNSFTLDFGDYSESYYSVQTTEGEQISQLIAGYIDIILKKKKGQDHLGIDGDEEELMVDDFLSPRRATIVQHQNSGTLLKGQMGQVAIPGVMRPGGQGPSSYTTGTMDDQAKLVAQTGQVFQAHQAPQLGNAGNYLNGQNTGQRALLGTIEKSYGELGDAQRELSQGADIPALGSDPASLKWRQNTIDVNKQNVGSQVAAITGATAQVVTLTSGEQDETDYTAVGAAICKISSNLGEMAKGVKVIAALHDERDSGESLLDAARRLAGAFSDLLTAAQPESQEPRQTLLTAATKIGEASGDIMAEVSDSDPNQEKEFQSKLLALSKLVANATAALVLQAKGVASQAADANHQNEVIGNATRCALSTSQLVACSKVVAPTIGNPTCQEQLVEASRLVAKSVEAVVQSSQMATTSESALNELGNAATAVTKALNDLLQHIKERAEPSTGSSQDSIVEIIIKASDDLCYAVGDANEMVRQARILAQATSELVGGIKKQAEEQEDSEQQKKLLGAAKLLADATAHMVEAAKGCAAEPADAGRQQVLKKAAEDLRAAANLAIANALRRKALHKLAYSAKYAASGATQNISAAQAARDANANQNGQKALETQCRAVADLIPPIVQAVRASINAPASETAPRARRLIAASRDFIPPASKMVQMSKAAVPTTEDQSLSRNLSNTVKQMAAALNDLRQACDHADELCGSADLDSAVESIDGLIADLQELRKLAEEGTITPLPNRRAEDESPAQMLGASSKMVGSAVAQLLTAAAQGNEEFTGVSARDTATALEQLMTAVREVAASMEGEEARAARFALLDAAHDVLDKSLNLVLHSKAAVQNPDNPDNQQKLAIVAKAVSNSLNNIINCLPGQKEVDAALKSLAAASAKLNNPVLPKTDKSYSEVQSEFNSAAEGLNVAASEIVTSARATPRELGESAEHFGEVHEEFIDTGLVMAGAQSEEEMQRRVVGGLKSVSMVSSKLLVAAKSLSADPSAPNAKNQLASAARAVTESINSLLTLCTSSAPGQKECESALRNLRTLKPMLENPSESVNEFTYFQCLDSVMEKGKALGSAMSSITNTVKSGQLEAFGGSIRDFSVAVVGLTECAAQSAYLIGIADPSSVAGQPGLVDPRTFDQAQEAISAACQVLSDPRSSKDEVLHSATVVAKHTSSLCNVCRLASSKTPNPVAKRHFVQSAKDVANTTADLVKAIKSLDGDFDDPARRADCSRSTQPLVDAVSSLRQFARSPEFASVPGKISEEAKRAQEPVTRPAGQMVESACEMIERAKTLAVNAKDPPTWAELAAHSKAMSTGIKELVTNIKERAPGQRECDEAIERLKVACKEADEIAMIAVAQGLKPMDNRPLEDLQEQATMAASELTRKIDAIVEAAKGEAERLGHAVLDSANFCESIMKCALGVASNSLTTVRQVKILEQSKTLGESAVQLLYAAKEGGGNKKKFAAPLKAHATPVNAAKELASKMSHLVDVATDSDDSKSEKAFKDGGEAPQLLDVLNTSADNVKEGLQDLLQTLASTSEMTESMFNDNGPISPSMSRIQSAVMKMDEPYATSPDIFVDYQTRMVAQARLILKKSQNVVAKSATEPQHLEPLTDELAEAYEKLAYDACGCISITSNSDLGERIKSSVGQLGGSCNDFVKNAVVVANTSSSSVMDSFAQQDLWQSARDLSEKVSTVMSVLQEGSRGTQACINAVTTISGIVGDLDTTILFASSGSFTTDKDDAFSDHRETILKTAKALVEDTKTLVAGAASSQEQLASAASASVFTISHLAEAVKSGAAALGSSDSEAQVLLLNAVKDVAGALADLITSTKQASGKPTSDPSMIKLKDSAKLMVTNVTSLLKTVKTVEDETTRGTRALEATIEALGQELRASEAPEYAQGERASAEDLIRYTKPVTIATARAVAAGNSGRQDDIIAASNMGRKALTDLLRVAKAAAVSAPNSAAGDQAMRAARHCTSHYRELLDQVHNILTRPAPDSRARMAECSRKVANTVTGIVQAAETVKGAGWVDPSDPTVVAENELLGAAASIEAAARKLAQLQPRTDKPREVDESLNFEEQILEAAKSIAAATAALIKAASATQRELVAQGKVSATFDVDNNDDDGQWSKGLISAARLVAAATHSLCESANSMVQGSGSEEKLIGSAKKVASSTAALLVAAKVKADSNSEAMKRLQAAGNAVKRAAEALVSAAQRSADEKDEEKINVNNKMVGGIAQEIMAQEEILRKEKELQLARKRLTELRKAKYKDKPAEADNDGSSGF